jgi:hypothetical protein
MRLFRILLSLAGVLLCTPSHSLYALDLTGNLRTQYYGFERLVPGGAQEENNLFFQSVSLRARDLGWEPLSLVTNLRVRGDASGNLEDGDTKIYSLYTELNDVLPAQFSMRLGRQFLYEGVGTGHFDGAKADVSPLPWLTLTGWAGTQVRWGAETTVAPWNEASHYGGRLLFDVREGTKAGLSYMRRMRDGRLERKILGADASSTALGWADVYFKAAVDLALEELRDAVVRVNPKLQGPLSLDLEYSRRTPRLAAGSFFTIIDAMPYHEVRVLPVYRLRNGVALSGEYGLVKYEGETTHRFRGGASWEGIAGGLHFREGYAGGRLGVYGSVRQDLPYDIEGLFQLDYAKYSLEEGESLESESLMAIARFMKPFARGANFVIELQEGVNPALDSDFRIYARIDYSFRIKR